MEEQGKEARRWLARQLAWETNLDRLVRAWEKEQGSEETTSVTRNPAPRGRPYRSGLPLQKPAA
jgi:hypothetical protein